MLLNGCQEGKLTPRLAEVLCPACGQMVEIFVRMGGPIGATGTLVASEICDCGHILPAGTPETAYKPAYTDEPTTTGATFP